MFYIYLDKENFLHVKHFWYKHPTSLRYGDDVERWIDFMAISARDSIEKPHWPLIDGVHL